MKMLSTVDSNTLLLYTSPRTWNHTLFPGALSMEGGTGDVPRSWPFSSLPIYHQCAHVPTTSPFQFLEIALSVLFLTKISAIKTQNFRIFAYKTPHFTRKTRSLDPTFGNPRGTYPHTHTHAHPHKVECPRDTISSRFCYHHITWLRSIVCFMEIWNSDCLWEARTWLNENPPI